MLSYQEIMKVLQKVIVDGDKDETQINLSMNAAL